MKSYEIAVLCFALIVIIIALASCASFRGLERDDYGPLKVCSVALFFDHELDNDALQRSMMEIIEAMQRINVKPVFTCLVPVTLSNGKSAKALRSEVIRMARQDRQVFTADRAILLVKCPWEKIVESFFNPLTRMGACYELHACWKIAWAYADLTGYGPIVHHEALHWFNGQSHTICPARIRAAKEAL